MSGGNREEAVMAFDLGGTKLHAALVDPGGRVLVDLIERTAGTAEELQESFRRAARHLVDRLPADTTLVGTGVGTAGVIKPAGGVITYAPNLPFSDFALGEWLAGFCPTPVKVLNDGRAAALGEYAFGDLAGLDPMLCLFYGTGIGIGVIVEGRLLKGRDNFAGEIGHTIHDPAGRLCKCGKRGCIETICGGGPMTARAREEIGDPPDRVWTVGALVALAAQGEERAQAILDDGLLGLRVLTANAVTLFNPAALVLGGGVMEGWPELLDLVNQGLATMVHPQVSANLQVSRSRLGSKAILLGAAAAALRSGEEA